MRPDIKGVPASEPLPLRWWTVALLLVVVLVIAAGYILFWPVWALSDWVHQSSRHGLLGRVKIYLDKR